LAGAREVILKTVEQSNPEEKTDWGVIRKKFASICDGTLKSKLQAGR